MELLSLEPMSSSSSSYPVRKFDVFLSFKPEDTRKSFVSFVCKGLDQKGLTTLSNLQRDGPISPELIQPIEDSKIAIVVISKNYTSSVLCLDELAKIIECRRKGSLIIAPVFYEVNLSDAKTQTGEFAANFMRHEEREDPRKVKNWRSAFTELTHIDGFSSRDWDDDSKLVDEITSAISTMLISITTSFTFEFVARSGSVKGPPRTLSASQAKDTGRIGKTSVRDKTWDQLISTAPSDADGRLGLDHHMKAVYGLLELESTVEVRVIGIWGVGCVGKTRLAKCVYEEISQHFHSRCFLENVKKICQDHGPSRLQEEFLSETLSEEALMIRSSNAGSDVTKTRLGHRKVLLVADGVDKTEQLQVVIKDVSWFGPGSRVIVTTRDKSLLIANGVEHIYELECLRFGEALQLFYQFAFKQKHPSTRLKQLSVRAVQLAGCLPLALKMLGSFLCDRGEHDWESTLQRLEAKQDKDVTEVPGTSYGQAGEQDYFSIIDISR